MKKLIVKMEDVGICEVYIDLVISKWSDKFSISKYGDRYTLIKRGRGNGSSKVQISEKQANELITKLGLKCVSDTLFKQAKTYISEDFILSEVNRLKDIKNEKQKEIDTINDIIISYRSALL